MEMDGYRQVLFDKESVVRSTATGRKLDIGEVDVIRRER